MRALSIAFILLMTPVSARSEPFFKNEKLLGMLKNSSFANALTTGTTLSIIYQQNKQALVYYINVGPETGHQNEGLIIFINGKYHHNYYINWSLTCKVRKSELICQLDDLPKIIERVKLRDIFAGKRMVIGGSFERPWCGSHKMCK